MSTRSPSPRPASIPETVTIFLPARIPNHLVGEKTKGLGSPGNRTPIPI